VVVGLVVDTVAVGGGDLDGLGVLMDARAVLVLVNLLMEERVARIIVVFCSELRLTTKHGFGVVLVIGRAIAWKATGASLDDTVCGDGVCDVLGVRLYRSSLLREE